jgi:hypothetical protein
MRYTSRHNFKSIDKMISATFTHNYGFDPQRCYDFSPYLADLSGIHLVYGLGAHPNSSRISSHISVKLVVEHPNMIHKTFDHMGMNLEKENILYDYILNMCPYSCSYLNERFSTPKYKEIFFPLTPVPLNDTITRDIPCYYSGHIFSTIPIVKDIYDTVNTITGAALNTSLTTSISNNTSSSYFKKMEIYNRTKICICHNVLPARHIPNIESVARDPLVIKHFPWVAPVKEYCPQIKSRMFEGAMMGCILLVYKDEYGITERYFKEGEEFLYFTDKDDLMNKVVSILKDYDSYKFLAENARKRYLENYSFSHFIERLKALR